MIEAGAEKQDANNPDKLAMRHDDLLTIGIAGNQRRSNEAFHIRRGLAGS
jgi:hypothetical protein